MSYAAYINKGTGAVCITKDDLEFQNNNTYALVSRGGNKKKVLTEVEDYFEENYVQDERRVVYDA